MNRSNAKAGSWSNLRVFSVSFKSKSRNVDNLYAEDTSHSFGDSSENAEGEKAWDQDQLGQKSFSASSIAQKNAAVNSERADSCESTPRLRRKSFKRIIEETLSAAPSVASSHAEKTSVPHTKHKTASKRDSCYFNLYTEAIDHQLFSDEELNVWDIQDRFPNDDLRLYEGLFSIEAVESPCPQYSPAAELCLAPANYIIDPLKGRIMHSPDDTKNDRDVTRSPAIHRKLPTAMATVHSISSFHGSHRVHHQSNHSANQSWTTFTARYPVFSRLSPALQTKFKKMAQRRQSAPSIVIRGVLGRSMKPSSFHGRVENPIPQSPSLSSQRLSLKFGSHGATLNLSKRKYVMEGKVQLTTGMQTQDRYMFLFTDLLLIAKAKSGSNFKLKYRIRVCELWIASCLDDVCELPKSSDKSFVMGWPTTNCVATFSTPESKELWRSALQKKIQQEKEKETPKTIMLKVVNRDSSNSTHVRPVTVSHKDTAKDVVRLAAKEFGFESEDEYQLWVMSRKEGTAYPLIGHENPHAILLSHIRDYISSNGLLPETEISSVVRYENLQPEMRDRCQFILRNTRQSPKYSVDMSQKRLSRLKAKTPAIFNWARKRSGQRNESSDSGHVSGNSVGSEGTTFFSSSPPSTSPPATHKLFSLPLGQVCNNGELPAPIASMLEILYRKAPCISGIFRKSASAKTMRNLKDKLDDEIDVDMDEVSIHVVAALVKDFLRNIPDSVMDCLLYTKWAQAIEKPDKDEKLKLMRSLLKSLDTCNRVLLRRLAIILNRIASQSDRNSMTSYNLAVCIAPSLLWPPGPGAHTETPVKATEILQYFTERCMDVFEGIAPTDVAWPPQIDLKSDDDDDYEGDNEKSTGTIDGSVSPISDVPPTPKCGTQLDNKEEQEEECDVTRFSRSGMIRRQLQRRKPGSKAESTRLLSLSQDSLDRVLGDQAIPSSRQQQTVDDMLLNGSELHDGRLMQRRGNHRARDACSMSNDSGFTTLSGEEEEAPARVPRYHAFPSSCSAGSNLNGLSHEAEESTRVANEELRKLWSPSLLKISNGRIVEEDELGGIKEEQPEATRGFASNGFIRRQSQPAFTRYHSVSVASPAGPHKASRPPMIGGSRLVQAITSPMIEYDGSGDDYDDEMTSPFTRQPPKYVRLNDRSDLEDESGLAKDYLRRLRHLSTDDVTEKISKSVTSSEGGGKHYMNGVKLAVGDVRPPTVHQYRPLTLSIRGITESDLRPHGFTSPDPESATSGNKDFFIGDGHSSGGTPDAMSSSQEDVFKGWDTSSRPSLDGPRGRSRTAPEPQPQAPKTAPLSRKFNSTRARRLNRTLTPDGDTLPDGCMSPIQKLTENLQMLPDFRQRSARKSTSDECHFFGRKKASSVREKRVSSSAPVPTLIEAKTNGDPAIIGTSFKANPATGSRSSVSDASRSSLDSSSRTSLKEESSQHPTTETTFERDIRARRPYSRRRCKLATASSNDGTFSKSLPSSDWHGMKDGLRSSLDKRESSRESVKSDDACRDVTRRRRSGPNVREADIIHAAGAVETKMRQLSGLSATPSGESLDAPTSEQGCRVHAGSVKSKISVFNHLIDAAGSPVSNSADSPVEFILRDNGEEFRIKRKNAVAAPPQNLDAPQRHQTAQIDHESTDKKRAEDSSRNGLVIRADPDSLARKNASERIKNALSVKLHAADDKSQVAKSSPNLQKSQQPVSDNLLFTLSESFAFGNRKSPRNITPSDSPWNSPVVTRRRRGDSRTVGHSCHSPAKSLHTLSDRPRVRHTSLDHHVGRGNPRSHVHVTSLPIKRNADDSELPNSRHDKPLSARDNNSNEIFPSIVYDDVIQSEESYV